jgi:lipopolysaccharide export system permease protein
LLRPVLAVLTIVGLLALGLAVSNLAARVPVLIPLIWVHAIAPGLLSAWVLFAPQRGARLLGTAREARVA